MTEPRLFHREFTLLLIAHFLQGFGFASMLTLPLYLDHLGADRTELGTIMAAAAIGGLLLRPAVAWALDVVGRKPTLFVGTLVVASAMGMFAFVDRLGPLVYIVRVVLGMGMGALFSAYFTFAADIVPAERRTEGLAIFGVTGLAGLLVNPFIGELDLDPANLRYAFSVLGGVVLCSLFALAPIKEPPKADGHESLRLADVLRALRHRRLWSVWFATLVLSSLIAMVTSFATVAAEHRGLEKPAMIWLTYALGAIGVRLFGGRLPDRIGPAKLLPPAFITYAAAAWLFASAQTLPAFLIAGALAGVAHGYCFPILTSQLITRMPASQRGSAMAMFTALWEITALFGPPLFGVIADRFGDSTMFTVGAVYSLGCILIWAPLERGME